CDLRGYTAFTETAEPEEVLEFLREITRTISTSPSVSRNGGGSAARRNRGIRACVPNVEVSIYRNFITPCRDRPRRTGDRRGEPSLVESKVDRPTADGTEPHQRVFQTYRRGLSILEWSDLRWLRRDTHHNREGDKYVVLVDS